ncbi:uncharacterized protein BT62DRAFT_649639 [Guyanagaster necrorhizus]|uniref:Uncharacterized protein n=1 Tax=Guyanagaster necrorhizus TaxID=856835 RepID=A0A9P7VG70_9AGAR|nr:uncharacterized protein BT62DRAFT_649639 [Guyanagaster necrorhizus MCA 3950]KAG7439982.1 hypothetical protein BT62DRAFT_649639 [Guyanagaster necrorhizus MCA 3950]
MLSRFLDCQCDVPHLTSAFRPRAVIERALVTCITVSVDHCYVSLDHAKATSIAFVRSSGRLERARCRGKDQWQYCISLLDFSLLSAIPLRWSSREADGVMIFAGFFFSSCTCVCRFITVTFPLPPRTEPRSEVRTQRYRSLRIVFVLGR